MSDIVSIIHLAFVSSFVFFVVSACNIDVNLEQDKDFVPLSSNYVIAHRGYWDSYIPQNSLSAFKRALQLDIYGSEMDVHQTIDGVMVVNHDYDFHGLSIAQSTYEELNKHTLSNGESLPLFESFLQTKKEVGGSVRLIVELKSCSVTDFVTLIDKYGLQNDVEYISFSSNLCNQLVSLGYGLKTYYLGGDIPPSIIKELGYGGIDYNSCVYDANMDWIKDARAYGLKTIVWTINSTEDAMRFIREGVLVTTDKPSELSIKLNDNEKGYFLRNL